MLFAGCWIFTDRAIFRFQLLLKLKLHQVWRIMLCVFRLLCVIHRPQSPTPFDVVRWSALFYSLTPSNRENWGGLSRSKFTIAVVTKIMLLPKPVGKIPMTSLLWSKWQISSSGFNTVALFSRRIFEIDNAPVNAPLIFWFCFAEMICSVTWNSPMGNYQIFDWRANILIQLERSVCSPTDRLKKGPHPCRRFFVAPAPNSSRFLCPRPPDHTPILLRAPNQNRRAMQAILRYTKRPHFLQQSDVPICFCFGPLLAGFFSVEAEKQSKDGLRRHASTNTRLRVSLLFDCKILKPITHAVYISNSMSPI